MSSLKPTQLPPNPFHQTNETQLYNAFNSCLRLESSASWQTLIRELDKPIFDEIMLQTSPQVAGRTLGYALIYAPSEASRDSVAREINAAGDDPEILAGLAHLYIFGMIRVFWNPKGPTPTISPDSSPRSSFRATTDDDAQLMRESSQTPTWLKDKLLLRDRYRCAFTHAADIPSMLRGDIAEPDVERSGFLQVVHIISQSLTVGVAGMSTNAQDKLRWASSAAAIIDLFASIETRSLLGSLDVHLPINAMMISHEPHSLFDQLGLWLTPVMDYHENIIADTYHIHLLTPLLSRTVGIVSRAEFRQVTDSEGNIILPPSAVLLAIHAACARIAHMSGAAEILDKFYEDDDAPPGMPLTHQDMSVNPVGAARLVRALDRVAVEAA